MIPAAGAGVLTVIVPVATVQVGCVGVAVGAAGADGAALINWVAVEIHPAAFLTVTYRFLV